MQTINNDLINSCKKTCYSIGGRHDPSATYPIVPSKHLVSITSGLHEHYNILLAVQFHFPSCGMRLHPLNNWKHQFQEPVPCWRQNIQVDQQTEVTFWLCQKLCAFPSATFTSGCFPNQQNTKLSICCFSLQTSGHFCYDDYQK